jgi:hypothetical protein
MRASALVPIPSWNRSGGAYGYQNGRFNLISPIQFNPDREDILTKAGKSAIEGQLLYQNPDPVLGDLRLVVIARFAERNDGSSRELIGKFFKEHDVGLHTFENIETHATRH